MTKALRSLRGDLRLAARPACLLVLLGVAVLAGLSSAVMQDTSYLQLQNARGGVETRVWEETSCQGMAEECRRARDDGRRATEGFLAEQRDVAARLGALQTVSGAVRFSATFMGLGAGAVAIALLATLTIAGEWGRGTMGLALAGGVTAGGLALRRAFALALLGLLAFAFATAGAVVAALWGQVARPLLAGNDVQLAKPLAGMVVLLAAYAATAAALAWVARDAMRTLAFMVAAIGIAALTTSLGRYSPGAAIVTALDIDRVLELEIGYLWVWPSLTFPRGVESPAHLVAGPGWPLAVAVSAAMAVAALVLLRRSALRSDPLG